MTDAQPGWYADPGDPRRWRWFDGRAWTEHVSLPVPQPDAAAYGATADLPTAYGAAPYGATVYAGAVAAGTRRPRTTPTRLVVIVGLTLAGVLGLGVVMSGVSAGLRAVGSGGARPAPGPATVFLAVAPATVDGLVASDDADLQEPLAQMRAGSDQGSRMLGGPGGTRGQAYAGGSDRVAFITWTTVSKPFIQEAVVSGIRSAWTKEHATGEVQYAEADGATLVCASLHRADGLPATLCSWVRSGSGMVQVVEIGGGGPAEIAGVTREVVGNLSGTA